ncbi:MAG: TonB family protein [Bacteroidales bacterium]|nr:TonB family protein [Bacteroidales bacterium]
MIPPFLLYLGRTSLYLALFYAFFLLVMRRTSLFRFNRVALLIGTVLCHLLPLLRLRVVVLTDVLPLATEIPASGAVTMPEPAGTSFPWLLALYLIGVGVILGLCLDSILQAKRIIRRGTTFRQDGCRLTLLEEDIPSFSWGRQIVMSRNDYENYPAILAHELQHIRHHHSLDVLLMTAVTALHWFNPLVWIARAELKLLHEYEADSGLLQQGIDATQYQLLLVRKAVGEQRFSLANGFKHAKLKQRITMMQRKPSSGWMRLAYAALLPLLAGTMFLCNPVRAEIRSVSVTSENELATPDSTRQATPYSQVEKKPTFNGENAEYFGRWVAQRLSYPDEAKAAGIQGRVMVGFNICEDGVVRDVKVLRGIHPALDAEAIRVVASSPKWEPGFQNGKAVTVTFLFPVIFQLRGSVKVIDAETVPHTEQTQNESGEKLNEVVVVSYPKTPESQLNVRGPAGRDAPLTYVDGIRYIGSINDLDVSKIESIEVLKDTAAVAKYGAEGKNGVILISTKKKK